MAGLQIRAFRANVRGSGFRLQECRPMINKPPPFKGLDIRILIIIPIKGRGFINHG